MYTIKNLTKQQLNYLLKRFSHIKSINKTNSRTLKLILLSHNYMTIRFDEIHMRYSTNYYSKSFTKIGMYSDTLAQAINAGLTTDIIQNG